MTVRVIPITDAYREGWARIFRRDSSRDRAPVCSGDDAGLRPAPGSNTMRDRQWGCKGFISPTNESSNLSPATRNNTPHATVSMGRPAEASAPRGVATINLNPERVDFTMANSFTGQWFGWIL